jgi:hypothetical protein
MNMNLFMWYLGWFAHYMQPMFTVLGIVLAVFSLFVWRVPITWAMYALTAATVCYYIPKG